MKIPTLFLASLFYLCLAFFAAAAETAQLSVEAIGAIRYIDLKAPTYGAGADVGFDFNKYVTGHARLLAYDQRAVGCDPGGWGGSAIDEGSLYVQAKLLRAANGAVVLSGIGGGSYDPNKGDFGFGVGLRSDFNIWRRLSLFAAGEIRAWMNQPKDALVTGGLSWHF
jgi:hypothetical protein